MKFNLFDTVKLKEPLLLSLVEAVPKETIGIIVEILGQSEAYLVELFGDWVKYDEQETLVVATSKDPNAFRETISVETVYPHQICLVKPARETVGIRAQLLTLINELPDATLEEVKDFAEFLKQKQHQETGLTV